MTLVDAIFIGLAFPVALIAVMQIIDRFSNR